MLLLHTDAAAAFWREQQPLGWTLQQPLGWTLQPLGWTLQQPLGWTLQIPSWGVQQSSSSCHLDFDRRSAREADVVPVLMELVLPMLMMPVLPVKVYCAR